MDKIAKEKIVTVKIATDKRVTDKIATDNISKSLRNINFSKNSVLLNLR